jgi:hypothetical protein
MPSLTTTKSRKRKVSVTHEALEVDAIFFAMRVADMVWAPRDVYRLTFGQEPPRGWSLSNELRVRTERELDAVAALDPRHPPSHDRRRQADVLSRVIEDGRLSEMEGFGHVWLSRGSGLRIEWGPVMTSAEMMVDYGLALLLDDTQPWGQLFFRCQLESCHQFFIAERPKYKGQFRYKYCSPEHQTAADAAKVADRVKRFRERQKESRK